MVPYHLAVQSSVRIIIFVLIVFYMIYNMILNRTQHVNFVMYVEASTTFQTLMCHVVSDV